MKILGIIILMLYHPLLINCQHQNCQYYGSTAEYTSFDICKGIGFGSNKNAEEIVNKILSEVGLKRNFILIDCPNINNAIAVNLPSKNGLLRYIIYDSDFMESIDSSNWSSISILAHEIGHHLNGHTLETSTSTHNYELEADEFSGFILGKLGANISQAQAAIKTVSPLAPSSSHPGQRQRLNAIKKGFQLAKGNSEEVNFHLENKIYANKNNSSDFQKAVELSNQAYKFVVKNDYKKAFELYTKSYELGFTEALVHLSSFYRQGHYVKRDYNKTLELLHLASVTTTGWIDEKHISMPQADLGNAYRKGIITEKDVAKGFHYLELSIINGNRADSALWLGQEFYNGTNTQKDYQVALNYLQESSTGLPYLSFSLIGDIYYEGGNGVIKDLKKAKFYYQKALDNSKQYNRYLILEKINKI